MARSKYRDRRIAGLGSNPAPEGSQRAGDRGVSAEQGGRVMRILSGKSAAACVREIEQRGSRLEKIEPAVQRIVDDVRRNGDRALLKYARKFDALAPKQGLRVSGAELRAAWKSAPASLRKALRVAEKNIRRFCEC